MHHETHTPLSTLFTHLMGDVSLLVRKEIELAKVEATEKVSAMGTGAAYLAVGGLLAFAGLLFLLGAATLAIALALPAWAAALIVGAAVTFVAGLFVAAGLGKFRTTRLKPERTLRTLRDDAAFARQHLQGV